MAKEPILKGGKKLNKFGVSGPKPLWQERADRATGKAQDADRRRYGTISDGKTPNYKPRKGVSLTASTVHQEKIKQSNQAYRNRLKSAASSAAREMTPEMPKPQFNNVGGLKKENF